MWQISAGMIVMPDGDIVVAGQAFGGPDKGSNGVLAVACLNSDGTPDDTFGTNGVAFIKVGQVEGVIAPTALAATPDGGLVVAGFFLAGNTAPPASLVLVEFNPANTLNPPAPTPPSLPSPIGSAPLAASDAVFASLADRIQVPGGVPAHTLVPPAILLLPSSFTPVPLSVPSVSQSEAVARISGGGETIAADDVFGLAGDSDRAWNLVLAGVAD
jgi:hypothetical protein